MSTELDSFSIKDLENRYSLVRSNIYNRLDGLKRKGYDMQPETRSGKSIYNAMQVAVMDALDRHLKSGSAIASFPTLEEANLSYGQGQDNPQLSYVKQDRELEKAEVRSKPQGFLGEGLIEVFLKGLAVIFPPPLPPARKGLELASYRELNEAAKEEYQLSTLNIANLLGLKPSTIAGYGEQFEDAGFIFTRNGRRKGGQIAWRVSKSSCMKEE
ncbi:hypothetical protein LEP3755_35860 [Leptolyngbya sp. NIES-3755]|nr:hypothetical protein LEP3755_35860 [Leptolyngbya sp. NIES-3755]